MREREAAAGNKNKMGSEAEHREMPEDDKATRPRRELTRVSAEPSACEISTASERHKAARFSSCCRSWPELIVIFTCIAAVTAFIVYAGVAVIVLKGRRTAVRERVVGTSSQGTNTDGVWTGVNSVRDSIPQLCRSGADLVCDRYEAVLVLGGGPAKNGTLPEWVKRRCDVALELYKCCKESAPHQRLTIITTSMGTFHTPNVVDAEGFPVSEARASSLYLVSLGVRPADIVEEAAGGPVAFLFLVCCSLALLLSFCRSLALSSTTLARALLCTHIYICI